MALVYGGAGHRQHGIYSMSYKTRVLYVWALEQISLRFETTYEEQDAMPDVFIMDLRLG